MGGLSIWEHTAEVQFGEKALRLPAKRAGEATVRVVERFVGDVQVVTVMAEEWKS